MYKPVAILISAATAMSGCATASKDIATAYVSPLQYQNFDCAQLALEAQRIQGRVVELGGRLDQAASNDKAIAGVGIILFWPVLFALGGTKNQEAEFARLKGEYDAIEQAAMAKKCSSGIPASAGAGQAAPAGSVSVGDAEQRLALLQEMRAKGILNDAEYNARRAELAESVLAGRTRQPVDAQSTAGSSVVGLRMLLRDADPVSRVVSSESLIVVDSVSERGAVLNGGLTTLDATGRVLTGPVPLPHVAGLGGGRLRPGVTLAASLVPTSTAVPPVEATVRALRPETVRIADREIAVVRCSISAFASGTSIAGLTRGYGATISGEVQVEPTTGLVISGDVRSQHPYYAFLRSALPAGVR